MDAARASPPSGAPKPWDEALEFWQEWQRKHSAGVRLGGLLDATRDYSPAFRNGVPLRK